MDDETDFTNMLEEYFAPRGYDVDTAREGGKALSMLREEKYNVVLLDLKMAGLNGDEVMAEIKKIDPEIKVIFITAYSDSGKTKERLMEEGAYAFVEKPVTSLKSLEELVNKAAKGA